jgi:hypothetical protein
MKKTVLILCITGLFCSCINNNDALFESTPVEVTFSAGATRATDATWTSGDAVGIYMLPTGVTTLGTAKKYTADAAGKLTPDGTANTLYYPIDGTGVRFMAYYPYNATSFEFADQSTKAKKEAVDFCFHRGTEEYSKSSPATSLNFTHKFSKIIINVAKGTGGPSCAGIKVTLSNMPKTATVDLEKLAAGEAGAIVLGTEATTIAAYTVSSSDAAATVEAIVPPHSGGGDFAYRVFRLIAASGDDKVYMLPNDFAFEAGMVYAFTFVLAAAGLAPNPPATQVSDGLTNCYMVAPGKSVEFPVSRAYMYENGAFTATLRVDTTTYAGAFGAAVIWDDNTVVYGTPTVSGSGNSAVVRVRTYNNVQGNAVVKIFAKDDATQTPVWSYHIWVTDYDPIVNTWTNTYEYDSTTYTFVFMDRNLGATEAALSLAARGLFYQWGRKDPFPAIGSVTTVATSSANGTVAYSIKNPNTFITAASSPYDWHYAACDDTLWGHGTTKSVYDPCPAGWRVPINPNMSNNSSPWYGVSAQNFIRGDSSGVNWGTNALYPAAGYRGYNNGSLNSVGINGYNWVASPQNSSSENASYLGFYYNGGLLIHGGSSRASGIPARCVRE